MPGYEGPPEYEDLPLGLDELAQGANSPLDDDPEQFGVGADLPAIETLEGMPGTHGLVPFPVIPGHPPEEVCPYPERYPNPEVQQKGIQTFSQWGDRTGGSSGTEIRTATPQGWQPYRMVRSPKVEGGGSALWMINLWAYEVVRVPTALEGPLSPLGADVILRTGGAAPSGDVGNAATKLKARIMWEASSGGTTRVVDIGQGVRCAIEASLVTVEVLFPVPGTAQVQQQDIGNIARPPQLADDGGIVLDTIVGASIAFTSSTPGQQLMTNTMIIEPIAGQADVPVFIPPGTRAVSVYQSSAGAVATPTWRFGRNVAEPLADLGTINLGADRRAVNIPRPGPAGMLLSGPADGQADRLLTYVFDLEI